MEAHPLSPEDILLGPGSRSGTAIENDFAVLRPNFSGPAITAVVEQARGPANPDKRAAPVAEAEKPTVQ